MSGALSSRQLQNKIVGLILLSDDNHGYANGCSIMVLQVAILMVIQYEIYSLMANGYTIGYTKKSDHTIEVILTGYTNGF